MVKRRYRRYRRGEGAGYIPGWGRYPGGENGNPLQYSCLGNPMDRGAWWATVHGVKKQLKIHFHSFSLLPFTEPFPASEVLSLTKSIQSICNPHSAPPGLRALLSLSQHTSTPTTPLILPSCPGNCLPCLDCGTVTSSKVLLLLLGDATPPPPSPSTHVGPSLGAALAQPVRPGWAAGPLVQPGLSLSPPGPAGEDGHQCGLPGRRQKGYPLNRGPGLHF